MGSIRLLQMRTNAVIQEGLNLAMLNSHKVIYSLQCTAYLFLHAVSKYNVIASFIVSIIFKMQTANSQLGQNIVYFLL